MVELLAPVRDRVSFSSAIDAGADAVYLGIGSLNMRINSPGIEINELPQIVKEAHKRGVKVYAALNSIVYDSELGLLEELLMGIKRSEADAVICWDLSVIQRAVEMQIPVHISTQASVSNHRAASFYHNVGAKRIILARELTIEQIKDIKAKTSVEIEVFIHGAMCVAVSGRCFISQFLSGHSGNRGDCLQPCRRSYRIIDTQNGDELELASHTVMSPKDLCALPILDKLIDAGVDVLKIEGRSRPPEYVRTVVSVYRRAIRAVESGDFNAEMAAEMMDELAGVYNRGFSTGFLLGKPSVRDWSGREANQSTRQKEYIGRVLHYFTNRKIAHAQFYLPVRKGQKIQIHGLTTGVYDCELTDLRTDEEGFVDGVERGIATFPCDIRLRRNDKIYAISPSNITENT